MSRDVRLCLFQEGVWILASVLLSSLLQSFVAEGAESRPWHSPPSPGLSLPPLAVAALFCCRLCGRSFPRACDPWHSTGAFFFGMSSRCWVEGSFHSLS